MARSEHSARRVVHRFAQEGFMALVRNAEPTTAFEKEMDRWDRPKRMGGMNADGYEPFPKMVYKAHQMENGKPAVFDMAAIYGTDLNQVTRAEAFNKRCELTVNSQTELDRAVGEGWRSSPKEALEYYESLQQDIAKAAAEAAYAVQRMTDKAQREYKAADEASEHPVTDVPAPKRGPKGTRVQVA
jgi:hypothetical protein